MLRASRNILFVNHSSKLGGAENVLSNLAPLANHEGEVFLFEEGPLRPVLQNSGLRVVVAKPGKDMSGIKRDGNLLKTALPLIGSMSSMVMQIVRAARKHDVIYANSQKAFILSAFAAMISRKKLVWHLHDILSKEHFSNAQIKLAVTLANNKATCVVVPSEATGRAFITAGGKPSLVRVVHNGVTFSEIDDGRTREQLRKDLGLPEGFLYGVFSRLSPWKGQHVAIEALQYLSNAKCIIVGDAQFGETEYVETLRKLSLDLGVSDRVYFLGHRTDVDFLMKAMDVYVHPSTSPEPFSLAILEAMHAGLPIVASNSGGIPEAVNDKISGYLFEPGSAKELASYVQILQVNTAIGRRMGSNAEQDARQKFSIEKMQGRWLEVVDSFSN